MGLWDMGRRACQWINSSMFAAAAVLASSTAAHAMTAKTSGTTSSAASGPSRLVPFPDFVADLKKPDSISRYAPSLAPDAAQEMRSYLLQRYDGVGISHSFMRGDQVFDCFAMADQPSLRAAGPHNIAAPPPFLPSQATGTSKADQDVAPVPEDGTDAFGNHESCDYGTVPIRRITPDEVARFSSLKRFFAKDLSSADDATPHSTSEKPDLSGMWVGTESQPGSPTPHQGIALYLNENMASGAISGTSTQAETGRPEQTASALLGGTVNGKAVTFDQKSFYLQNTDPGVTWCLAHAALVYSTAGAVPTLIGNLRSAGCKPAEVRMARAVAAHKYATRAQPIVSYGGLSTISLWKPAILQGLGESFSLAQEWYSAGSGAATQTAEVGWQVYPQKYGTTKPVFFSYWTADDYVSTGCYNTDCPGYVQTGKTVAPGASFSHWGMSGTQVYAVTTGYFLYKNRWWLSYGDAWIGYYPASLYRGGGMARASQLIQYGGETVGAGAWPAMGSGKRPIQPDAAFQKDIYYRGAAGRAINTHLSEQAISNTRCYNVSGNKHNPASYFYFGGPGGRDC